MKWLSSFRLVCNDCQIAQIAEIAKVWTKGFEEVLLQEPPSFFHLCYTSRIKNCVQFQDGGLLHFLCRYMYVNSLVSVWQQLDAISFLFTVNEPNLMPPSFCDLGIGVPMIPIQRWYGVPEPSHAYPAFQPCGYLMPR